MSRVDLEMPGEVVEVVVSGRRESVEIAGGRVGVLVDSARAAVEVPGVRNSVAVGGEYADPRLLTCRLYVAPNLGRYSVTLSMWNVPSKVAYSVWNHTTGVREGVTAFYPSSAGTSYAQSITGSGLTIGDTYSLWYWLDCDPDVSGYTEGWVSLGFMWIQSTNEEFEYAISQ